LLVSDLPSENPRSQTRNFPYSIQFALIPVFAYGLRAEAFSGVCKNTEIFYKILEATNLKPKK